MNLSCQNHVSFTSFTQQKKRQGFLNKHLAPYGKSQVDWCSCVEEHVTVGGENTSGESELSYQDSHYSSYNTRGACFTVIMSTTVNGSTEAPIKAQDVMALMHGGTTWNCFFKILEKGINKTGEKQMLVGRKVNYAIDKEFLERSPQRGSTYNKRSQKMWSINHNSYIFKTLIQHVPFPFHSHTSWVYGSVYKNIDVSSGCFIYEGECSWSLWTDSLGQLPDFKRSTMCLRVISCRLLLGTHFRFRTS